MDVRDLIRRHYSEEADVTAAILAVLRDAGVDVNALTVEDLHPVDQLHAGFAAASAHVLDLLDTGRDMRLLDVGCGIGGTARMAAQRGARVTGVDLTEALVIAAARLTDRVGLGDRVRFLTASAERLDLADGSHDAAVMIHVGMNLPDKAAVFGEVRRVLVPGSRFVVFDQVRAGDGELPYPQPWAVDEQSSFVESQEAYETHLVAAGFRIVPAPLPTPEFAGPPQPGAGPPPLSPAAIFGEAFADRLANNIAAHKAGLLAAVPIVAVAA